MTAIDTYHTTGNNMTLKSDWKTIKLKRVAELRYGESLSSDQRDEEGVIDVYGSNGVVGKHSIPLTKAPCIIIGRKGSYGKINYSRIPCFPIDTTYYIDETSTSNDIRFVFYLLQSLGLDQQSRDSAIPGLNREEAYRKECLIPKSIIKQKEIANYLDNKTEQINRIIRQKEILLEKLKAKLQAIVDDEFLGKNIVSIEKKFYDTIDNIQMPKHWSIKPLKHNTYMKGRIGWQGLRQEEFIEEGPHLITGMNFKNGKIKWDEVYHISNERYNEAPEIQLMEGDVLMTKDGTIGKLLYVDYLPGPTSLNSHLLVLRCIDNSYLPKFLYYQLQSFLFKRHIELTKSGTTFFGITQEAVSQYKMILPSISEQQKIVKFLEDNFEKFELLNNKLNIQINKLSQYRQSLISEVVTGKIKVI